MRELTDKNESAWNKWKFILLDVDFESHIDGVLEEIADHGNVDTAANPETQAMEPQEHREGELIDIIEENDKEWPCSGGRCAHKKLYFKGTLRDSSQH